MAVSPLCFVSSIIDPERKKASNGYAGEIFAAGFFITYVRHIRKERRQEYRRALRRHVPLFPVRNGVCDALSGKA